MGNYKDFGGGWPLSNTLKGFSKVEDRFWSPSSNMSTVVEARGPDGSVQGDSFLTTVCAE